MVTMVRKKKRPCTKREVERAKKRKAKYAAKSRLRVSIVDEANVLRASVSARRGRRKVTIKAVAQAVNKQGACAVSEDSVRRLMNAANLRGLRRQKAPPRVKNEEADPPTQGCRNRQGW